MTTFTEADVLAGKDVSGQVRQPVLVNRATGVNPKPWLKDGRFLQLRKNEDGAPFLPGPSATLEAVGGEVRPVALGRPIFANRAYAFHDTLPACLRGRSFVFSGIDRATARITTGGVVYVLTPTPDRNHDSVADALTGLGFARADVPEFVLFLSREGHVSSANAVTVFQREMRAGEDLSLGKWSVIVF
jgi:hypothetical protein